MAHTIRGAKRKRLTDSAIRRLDKKRKHPFNPRADLFKQITAMGSTIILVLLLVLIGRGGW